MRFLGAVLFVIGSIGLGWSVREIDRRSRPADVAFALLAPACAIASLLGLVLIFVPDFL